MQVAILGCGYVGLELGRQLVERGHDVVGVRRSAQGVATIEDAGFDAVQVDVTDSDALAAVPDVDAVVFIASSGGRGAEAAREIYVDGLRTTIDHFGGRESTPEQLLYTSSTGVYGDHDGDWVDETTPIEPTTEKTAVLAEAERIATEVAAEHGMDGSVVRFAGLYGPDRYRLERYVEGPVTEGYLNMIHRDDAAGIVRFVLEETADRRDGDSDSWPDPLLPNDVLLAVDDEPVSKWAFADWLAEECGEPAPEKRTIEERLATGDLSEPAERRLRTSKRCSNDLLHEVGYELAYPTFREGYRQAIEAYGA
ncbi:NAD-dependent epimerase/dehydratase [Salinarchaeum sp. Harcht-Bsk1]|uniref:SDR family oxidoreductase n=1 Tax=Salinarchaeum sp. Harcht-Bsk1 TaxID=1333523 RepID=UPI0003423895|nr:SDR family oxidoreductase [Salinarchaeum sp. Harcht-Bsk1]AGN02041.1 NAD-dependent epimerase/dehydratase [Salinarchaeum sp. Harcht-Bsk1]